MLNPALVSAYRFHKARMLNSAAAACAVNATPYVRRIREESPPAVTALRQARQDLTAGKERYPHDGKPTPAVCWQRSDDATSRRSERLAYVQSIEGAGLRRVGEVVGDCGGRNGLWNTRSYKSGWYTDPYGDVFNDGSSLCWGVVYQLPARGRKARFVPGYVMGGCSDDLPTVDFSMIYEEDARDGYNDNPQDYDAARQAAHVADSMARIAAEEEREYQSAYGAGSRYAELGLQVAEWRKAILALGRDRRAAKGAGNFPAICSAVRKAMSDLVSDISEARQEREKLVEGDGGEYRSFWPGDKRLQAAFNEGAGESVFA